MWKKLFMQSWAGCLISIIFMTGDVSGQTPAVSAAPEHKASSAGASNDAASLLERAKHPFPWLTFNADLRVRQEYYDNAGTLNSHLANHEYNYQRYRARIGVVIHPFENLDIGARLITERRSYLKPDSMEGFRPDEFLIDNLYVTWRNSSLLPAKITLGRQELNIGSGWLIGDGTSGDGSRTGFFDAARVTLDWESAGTTLDLAAIVQPVYGNTWLPILHDLNKGLSEQNENGFVANLSNKSIAHTQIDGYFIYKHNSRVLRNGDQGEIYVIGGKLERAFTPHWKLQAEIAPEWGKKNGSDFRALGSNNRLTYTMEDKYHQSFRIGYEYLSGDNPSSQSVNEAFDILWGRWPQWSDLHVFSMAREKRVSDWTNLHRISLGWTLHPMKQLEMAADYMPMFAPQNSYADKSGFSGDGKYRGSLAKIALQYAFTRHIHGKLLNEFFFPGSYYTAEYRSFANFIRAEMLFAW